MQREQSFTGSVLSYDQLFIATQIWIANLSDFLRNKDMISVTWSIIS